MPDVLDRAIGRQQLKSYAVASEDLLVTLSDLAIDSTFQIGGDHHCARRQRFVQPNPEGDDQYNAGAGGDRLPPSEVRPG